MYQHTYFYFSKFGNQNSFGQHMNIGWWPHWKWPTPSWQTKIWFFSVQNPIGDMYAVQRPPGHPSLDLVSQSHWWLPILLHVHIFLIWLPFQCFKTSPKCQHPAAPLYLFHTCAMVEISSRVELKFQDEKPICLPKDLIIQFDGHQYLKLRPTSFPIVQFIHGGKVAKNASLSSSTTLKGLIQARDDQYQGNVPQEEGQEALFDDANGPAAGSKRPLDQLEEPGTIVQIDCNGTSIDCLMVGKRPARTDFTFLLEASQVEAIVMAMRKTSTKDLEMPTRAYNKDAKRAKKEWPASC